MAKDFLGTGWKFPVISGPDRKIAVSQYEDDIKEAIWIILGTAKGERIMRPDFGCSIHDFVFSTVNASTITLIEKSVREALTIWEPRVELFRVNIDTSELEKGRILVNIDYRVRNTNNRFNLVYPFYLKEG